MPIVSTLYPRLVKLRLGLCCIGRITRLLFEGNALLPETIGMGFGVSMFDNFPQVVGDAV